MNIKIHSNDLNRMMKVVGQCIDSRHQMYANVEIKHEENMLYIRGTNGSTSVRMCTPMMGGDGESFCIDGTVFQKVCAICNGMIELSTDGKNCIVKGTGRTRIPIVKADIPEIEPIYGASIVMDSSDYAKCYSKVAYAVSADQTRIILTGILTETDGATMNMVALDGFQLSKEETMCEGDPMKIVIPAAFAGLIAKSALPGDKLLIVTDNRTVVVSTDDMVLKGALLAGEFIDYEKILPVNFTTEVRLKSEAVRDALKSGSVVNTKQKLIRIDVGSDSLKLSSNSEQADYEADIECETIGNVMSIAFDERYLMNAMNAIGGYETAVIKLNSSVSPAVISDEKNNGVRLLLPVRIAGVQQ